MYYRRSDLKTVWGVMADGISPQALSDLIGSIYDCALDPSRWDQTLADVSKALDCFALLLALNDLRHERLLIHKRVGVEPDQFERLSIYVPEVTAQVRGALASWPSLLCRLVNGDPSFVHMFPSSEPISPVALRSHRRAEGRDYL
jgi:hypothetical protein